MMPSLRFYPKLLKKSERSGMIKVLNPLGSQILQNYPADIAVWPLISSEFAMFQVERITQSARSNRPRAFVYA
jgi:hypothetical protein